MADVKPDNLTPAELAAWDALTAGMDHALIMAHAWQACVAYDEPRIFYQRNAVEESMLWKATWQRFATTRANLGKSMLTPTRLVYAPGDEFNHLADMARVQTILDKKE